MAQDLPVNEKVVAKAADFDLVKLLRMDTEYFTAKIWPHMFYMSPDDMWRWKMNVARVMGNTLDQKYVSELIQAFKENDDERVRGMIAWALGRLGGADAKKALESFRSENKGIVREEIELALGACPVSV